MNVERVFCWKPTHVWSSQFYRDGFVWLRFAYRGKWGLIYKTKEAAQGGKSDG